MQVLDSDSSSRDTLGLGCAVFALKKNFASKRIEADMDLVA
jgi:hypothetical protein